MQASTYLMRQLDRTPDPRYLRELYETLSDLDPSGIDHYLTGAIFLAGSARRYQDALDLLAKADGKGYKLDSLGRRVLEDRTVPRRLPAGHPREAEVLKERANILLVALKDHARAGKTFLELARLERDEKLAEEYGRIGRGLVARAQKLTEGEAIDLELAQWEARLGLASDAMEKVAQARVKELRARRSELALEEARRACVLRHGEDPRIVADLMRYGVLAAPPEDPFGTGFVFFEGGRVVSPGHAVSAFERMARGRLDRFERNAGRRAATLLEAEIGPHEIPAWLEVGYDPASGELRVGFRPARP
jgi:hypothetical protein